MSTCMICHFLAELDDMAVRGPGSACVCLRCYARETDNEKRMSPALRRELAAALMELEVR